MSGTLLRQFKRNPTYIKLTRWEFWPFYFVYIPVFFYLLYAMFRSRSLFFFSASNPAVDTGGVFGESKFSVLRLVPAELKPRTLFIPPQMPNEEVLQLMQQSGIGFPVIIKPDVGERGLLVEKISDPDGLKRYRARFCINLLIQEFVSLPYEYNVLYYRYPGSDSGLVTSITGKELLSVTGNGYSTVEELLLDNPYAIVQMKRLKAEKRELLQTIPKTGETVVVEPIGNHARGTLFTDKRNLIDAQVLKTFDKIASRIPGMFIYRFDVKCNGPDDLKTGKNLKLVEVNGAGGEPTHIYQPGYPLRRAWKDLLHHWRHVYRISHANHRQGVPYMPWKEGLRKMRSYLQYKASVGK